jgi:thiamine kinase-like enzyme
LKALESKKLPVPHVYVSEVNEKFLGVPFILMEKVRGKSLRKCLEGLSNGKRFDVINRFAQTLAFQHSLKSEDVNFLRRPSDEYDYAKCQAVLAKNLQKNLAINVNFDWIIRWIESNASLHPCHQYSIIHGDMHLDNFLVAKNGKIVSVDWEYPEIGDALKDVALAYLNLIFAFGTRKQDKGRKIGEFFIRQYAKSLNKKIDPSAFRFYTISSALIETICYRFNYKQALNPLLAIRKLGIKYIHAFPFIPWYFWSRSKILERLIIEKLSSKRDFSHEFYV